MSSLGRGAVITVVALLATAIGACGDDGEDQGPFVTLRVTRDFGQQLLSEDRLPLEGHRTPLALLEANHEVRVDQYQVIDTIDGLRDTFNSPTIPREEQLTWETEVNGIEIDVEPHILPLAAGDVVQFDLGNLEGSYDSRATVGAFPQPFTGGLIGYRPTVTVECAKGYRRSCASVKRTLRAVGVDPTGRPPKQRPASRRIRRARFLQPVIKQARILVGPWPRWRHRRWPHLVDRGPDYGGVNARFSTDASTLRLLDWHGNPVRTLGTGTGLVAAMCPLEPEIVWLVTGVDRLGVERAVRALKPAVLEDAFAVAVTGRGIIKLPLRANDRAARQAADGDTMAAAAR